MTYVSPIQLAEGPKDVNKVMARFAQRLHRAAAGWNGFYPCVTPVASGGVSRFRCSLKQYHACSRGRRLIWTGLPLTSPCQCALPRDQIRVEERSKSHYPLEDNSMISWYFSLKLQKYFVSLIVFRDGGCTVERAICRFFGGGGMLSFCRALLVSGPGFLMP